MAYDIYGNILERGHCEVHPWVNESYPCPECIGDNKQSQQYPEPQYPEPTLFDQCMPAKEKLQECFDKIILAYNDESLQQISMLEFVKSIDLSFIEHLVCIIRKENEVTND